MPPKLILTEDGSPTLYSPEFGDHYHSTHGALQESRHVFIEAGLKVCAVKEGPLRILEVGLGTGLNVLLTACSHQDGPVEYTALETHPLEAGVIRQLLDNPYPDGPPAAMLRALHDGPWEEPFPLSPDVTVIKRQQSVTAFSSGPVYDLVYFDAFSPAVQPELWTEAVFRRMFDACREGAVLVTYSSKGSVRRAMAAAGFLVEKISGPPGKREMVRARKPGS